MLIWGIYFGAISLFASLRAMGRRKPRWLDRWFQPWGKHGETGFLRRAKLALSPYNHVYTLPLFSPALLFVCTGLLVEVFVNGVQGQFLLGILVGYLGSAAIAYPLGLHRTLTNFRKELAIFAAQKIARRLPPSVTNDLLVPLTTSPSAGLRIAAAMGLRELGTKDGNLALEELSKDPDANVSSAARAASSDLHLALQGKGLLSVRTMDTYASEHAYLRKSLHKRDRQSTQDHEEFAEITRQMDEIVFSQLALRRSFPDVYCLNCNARGEQQHYEEWDWVRCGKCKEVHGLRAGVKRVVGEIGGTESWNLQEGLLHINLWDEGLRKALSADLDALAVIGGQEIHYDWAVAAVVNALLNHGLGADLRLAVQIVQQPPLEPNSLQLLKSLDPSLMLA